MKRFIGIGAIGAAALLLALATTGFSQPGQGGRNCGGNCGNCMKGGNGGAYDPAKAETVTGQVTAVEEVTGRKGAGRGPGVALKLQTASGELIVHLGPRWYLDKEQSVKIAAGDTVEVTGERTMRRGEDIFLAAEVKKGSEVLKLRDGNGIPLWARSRGNQPAN